MEALMGTLLVAFLVAFVALLPKGSHYSKKQFELSREEVDRILRSKS